MASVSHTGKQCRDGRRWRVSWRRVDGRHTTRDVRTEPEARELATVIPDERPPTWHRPLLERLNESIEVDANGCWIWQGNLMPGEGYGRIFITLTTGRPAVGLLAHRVSYEHFVGPIPDGLTIDHLCRVRRCVNPDHLEPVTNIENVRRQWAALRKGATPCN